MPTGERGGDAITVPTTGSLDLADPDALVPLDTLGASGGAPGPDRGQSGSAAGALDVSARHIRREHLHQLVRSKTFLVGGAMLLFWVVCAVFGGLFEPSDPLTGNFLQFNAAPTASHWFGTDYLGRDVLSRVIAGSRDILIVAPLGDPARHGGRHGHRPGSGLLPWRRRQPRRPAGGSRAGSSRRDRGVPLRGGARSDDRVRSSLSSGSCLRCSSPAPCERRSCKSASSTTSRRLVCAARVPCTSCSREILPNVLSPILVEFTVRLGYAIFAIATLSFLGFGIQAPTPDWGADISHTYGLLSAGYWWETLFPALAIASLVVAVNLISDSIESVLVQ